jgi:hypothetical protein
VVPKAFTTAFLPFPNKLLEYMVVIKYLIIPLTLANPANLYLLATLGLGLANAI